MLAPQLLAHDLEPGLEEVHGGPQRFARGPDGWHD
jgi:hypothetical protein